MSINTDFTYNFVNVAEMERATEAQNAKAPNGGGWLLAMALALGKIADNMGERMLTLAGKIDNLQAEQAQAKKGDAPPTDQESGMGLTELNAQLQVLGQQLGQMLQMTATIIKTIGEGNKDLARKQ